MCYGERIKNYIISKGIKQQKVSELTGIKQNVLSAMLNGNRRICVVEYVAICEALGVSVAKFTEQDEH